MDDPRSHLGFTVESEVRGPYQILEAKPTSPDQGGTLDRAILAHTLDGRQVVIGEIWAAGHGESGKIRLNAEHIAHHIIELLEAHDKGPEQEAADGN